MKFFRYITVLALLPLAVTAQKTGYTLPAEVKELATYVPTSTSIKGQKYIFPGNIHSYYSDPDAKEIIIVVKKDKEIKIGATAELFLFDTKKNMVKWSDNINSLNVYVSPKYILTMDGGNTRCYNRADGKQLWKKTGANVKYIDQQKGIVVTDHMSGLDIHSGKARWQRYMPMPYNWEDIYIADDSSIIVASGGLYRINLYTGKGWSTGEYTTKEEFTAPSSLGVVPASVQFPEASIPEIKNETDVWKSTTSGILAEGNTIYFASKRRLMAIDKESGQLKWETRLPEERTGITSLYFSGDDIVLFNEGKIRNAAGATKKYGKPYFASFKKVAGTQNYIREMPGKEDIKNVHPSVDADHFVVLFANGINQYAANDGHEIGSATVQNNVSLNSFVESKGLFHLSNTTGTGLYAYSDQKTLFLYDINAHKLNETNMSDLEVGYEYGRYTLRYNVQNNIVRDNKSLVLTPESNKGVMMDDKLFIAEGNSLSVIPIEEPRP